MIRASFVKEIDPRPDSPRDFTKPQGAEGHRRHLGAGDQEAPDGWGAVRLPSSASVATAGELVQRP